MDSYIWLREKSLAVLQKAYPQIGDDTGHFERVVVEPTRDAAHGDCAINAALVLAKPLQMKPREIAEQLCNGLGTDDHILSAEIAGPGFVNIRLSQEFWLDVLTDIIAKKQDYGNLTMGAGALVNVEYVSANPTGPLHVGHTRGAVVGDALASLLTKAGYQVMREYYVNDAGSQIATLAQSSWHRYLQALGEDVGDIAKGLYPGEYLIKVGQDLANLHGDKLRALPKEEAITLVGRFCVDAMMDLIRQGLEKIQVRHDIFSHESAIVAAGQVDKAIARLQEAGAVYKGALEKPKGSDDKEWLERTQLLFRSTQYGDDQDRALQKHDGSWTYFAPDIAYHYDKYCRGFHRQINILGADHSGYAKRIQAATNVASGGEATLEILLCNIVRLLQGGQVAKMSKRAGTFVTLDDFPHVH
ncbi:MAG: arginine--tRNA ligase [Pseudomonadota bacterium]